MCVHADFRSVQVSASPDPPCGCATTCALAVLTSMLVQAQRPSQFPRAASEASTGAPADAAPAAAKIDPKTVQKLRKESGAGAGLCCILKPASHTQSGSRGFKLTVPNSSNGAMWHVVEAQRANRTVPGMHMQALPWATSR